MFINWINGIETISLAVLFSHQSYTPQYKIFQSIQQEVEIKVRIISVTCEKVLLRGRILQCKGSPYTPFHKRMPI